MDVVYLISQEKAKADFHKRLCFFPVQPKKLAQKKEGTKLCLPLKESYFLKLSFRLTLRLNTR